MLNFPQVFLTVFNFSGPFNEFVARYWRNQIKQQECNLQQHLGFEA